MNLFYENKQGCYVMLLLQQTANTEYSLHSRTDDRHR